MALNPVNLCADLQAWHGAGLALLYFPQLEPASLYAASLAAVRGNLAKEIHQDVDKTARTTANNLAENFTVGTIADGNTALRHEQSRPLPRPGSASADELAAERQRAYIDGAAFLPEQGAGSAAAQAAGQALPRPAVSGAAFSNDNTALPAHWAALEPKLRPAPVIWTYLELGEDLLLQGDPARSKVLKELIASLGLKKGSSSFLPLTLPQGAQDGSEAWCFQACLSRLGGLVVIVLGAESLEKSPYAGIGLTCFQERIVQGRIVLCLPSFAELLSDPARLEATKVFLRSAFARINIL